MQHRDRFHAPGFVASTATVLRVRFDYVIYIRIIANRECVAVIHKRHTFKT